MKIKRILASVFAGVIAFGCCFGLAGCKEGPILTSGDFEYCYVNRAGSNYRLSKDRATGVTILSLAGDAKVKEVIVIPESIDGLPVIAIGMSGMAWGVDINNGIYTKIYLPKTLITTGEGMYLGTRKRFFIDVPNDDFFKYNSGIFYVPEVDYSKYQKYIDLYQKYVAGELQNFNGRIQTILIANLTYIVDDEVYWIDDYEDREYVKFPEEPYKEGYVFDGWYKEPECLNKWEEETEPYRKSKTLNTINLYAKWIKN
jgi:uncharacterized repeat protein (TIGR02543 family)